jgi:hypothetical protein
MQFLSGGARPKSKLGYRWWEGKYDGAGAFRSRVTGGAAVAAAVRRLQALHTACPVVVCCQQQQVHAPFRPRQPTGGVKGVVAACGPVLLTAANALIAGLPLFFYVLRQR